KRAGSRKAQAAGPARTAAAGGGQGARSRSLLRRFEVLHKPTATNRYATMDVQEAPAFSISARAARRIAEILSAEGGEAMLRVAVTGGGCSGFQYSFALADTRAEDDLVIERDGVTVLVDPMSLDFLKGA